MADPRCSGGAGDAHCATGAVTLKFYMGFLLDGSARRDNGSDISVFGRVKSGLAQGCAMATALSTAAGMPAAGTYTLTFDAAMITSLATNCQLDASGDLGQAATVVVTDTTDTTYYDKKFSMNVGGDTQTAWLRVTDAAFNILTGEVGSTNYSCLAIAMNRTTNVVRAEYLSYSSSGSGGGEWHRLFYDPSNNSGAVVGSSFDHSSPVNKLLFTLRGKPGVAGSEVAYSVGVVGFGLTSIIGGASTVNLNHFKGCVNIDSGVMTTDDSITCAGSVTGVDTSGGLATVFGDMYTAITANPTYVSSANVVGETHSVPFTNATDLYTSAIPAN